MPANPLNAPLPDKERSKRPLIILAGLLILVMIAGVISAGISQSSLTSRQASGWEEIETLATLSEDARSVQVAFKTQVHEWKNTLLRGHDPADYNKYHSAFLQQQQKVGEGLQSLETELGKFDLSTDHVKALLIEHERVKQAYQDVLSKYRQGEQSSTFETDAAIRGVDRELNESIDLLVDEIREAVTTRRVQIEEESRQRLASASTTQNIILVLGLVLVISMLVIASKKSKT